MRRTLKSLAAVAATAGAILTVGAAPAIATVQTSNWTVCTYKITASHWLIAANNVNVRWISAGTLTPGYRDVQRVVGGVRYRQMDVYHWGQVGKMVAVPNSCRV